MISTQILYVFTLIIILVLGLIGNLSGYIVISNKKVEKIGPIKMLKFLFLADTLYLLQIIMNFVISGLGIDFSIMNSIYCKLYRYLMYSYDAVSPWILVYFITDRLLTIIYSKKILRQKNIQSLYFICLIIFNLGLYVPVGIYYDVVTYSVSSNETSVSCSFIDNTSAFVITTYDSINLLFLPFIIMTAFSIILSYNVIKFRQRVAPNTTRKQKIQYQREINLAISSVSSNIISLILNFPLAYIPYTNYDNFTFFACYYVFMASYGINFYVLLITNKLIRKTFLDLFIK